jgi:hypothetical protein
VVESAVTLRAVSMMWTPIGSDISGAHLSSFPSSVNGTTTAQMKQGRSRKRDERDNHDEVYPAG